MSFEDYVNVESRENGIPTETDNPRMNAYAGIRNLFQDGVRGIGRTLHQIKLHDGPCTGIPAEQGIIVSGWTNGPRFLEPVHGITKAVVRIKLRPGSPLRESGLGAAFGSEKRLRDRAELAHRLSQRRSRTDAFGFRGVHKG